MSTKDILSWAVVQNAKRHQTDFQKDHIYIFAFKAPSDKSVINHSPFCTKVILYLEMRKLPYTICTDVFPGPRGQLPFIELNGKSICESNTIISYLDCYFNDFSKYPRVKYSSADPTIIAAENATESHQRATTVLLERTIENSLYFKLLYCRWYLEEGWSKTSHFFANLSFPLSWIVPYMARRSQLARLEQTRVTRLTIQEINLDIERDFASIDAILGSQKYMMGTNEPTMADIHVFSLLDVAAQTKFDHGHCPVYDQLVKHENLMQYIKRMRTFFKSAY